MTVGAALAVLGQVIPASAAVTVGSATINAPLIKQQHALGCEAAALQIALAAVGVDITQNWAIAKFGDDPRRPVLGRGRVPVRWGDPYQSFVGNVNGSEVTWTGYGVYYPPVARAAEAAGTVAQGGQGWSPQQLYAAVAAGDPVIVWVPHLLEATTVRHWTTWSGTSVWYAQGEHAQVLVGYDLDAQTVTLDDPLDGQLHTYPMALFQAHFAQWFGSAVVIRRPQVFSASLWPTWFTSGA